MKMKNNYQKKLKKLRSEIDQVDRALLSILKKRSAIVQKIAVLKIKNKLPIIQKSRNLEIQKNRRAQGEKLGLAPQYINKLFQILIRQSVQDQRNLVKKKSRTK